jgi:hypothetical protein
MVEDDRGGCGMRDVLYQNEYGSYRRLAIVRARVALASYPMLNTNLPHLSLSISNMH